MYFRQQPVGTIVLNGMMLGEELGITICGCSCLEMGVYWLRENSKRLNEEYCHNKNVKYS